MAKLKTVLPTELVKKLEDERVEQKAGMNPELAALPEKRRKLVMVLLRSPTMSWNDALRQAGYIVKPGANHTHTKRSIQGVLAKTFEAAGVYELDIARIILRALDATKNEKVPRETYYSDGRLKEKKTDLVPVPDYKTQLSAAKLLAQLGGYFFNKVQVTGNVTHEAIFRDIDPAVLEARARQLEKNGVQADFEVVDE